MEQRVKFTCTNDGAEEIPKDVIIHMGVKFPEVHTHMGDMASVSKAIKEYRQDTICKLPFCATVEAEAMGADINLGDGKNGPRVNEYAFNSIEELTHLGEIDLSGGRIRQVLDAVEHLSHQHEVVGLNVEGPFTIASSLIDPRIFYKGLRKNRALVDRFLQVVEDNIVKYAMEGVRRGARLLSYADPAGALDIVGPKVYQDVSGKCTFRVLKQIQSHSGDFMIHLCGKTSTALEKFAFSRSAPVKYDEGFTYGEAISNLPGKNPNIKIIGHGCIKRTPLKSKKPVLWQVLL